MKKLSKLLIILLVLPSLCVAEDEKKEPTILSDSWQMTPKAGHSAEFEKALIEHMKFRVEDNDPRSWQVFTPVTGSNISRYIVRSCCTTWAEFDAYDTWYMKSESRKHYFETVHPHVAQYNHNFSQLDTKNSSWKDDAKANYVGVSTYKMKVGGWRKTGKAIEEVTKILKENNWPKSWSWSYPEGGEGVMQLVTPYENYAAMESPEETVYKVVKKHLKSEKKADKLFEQFRSGIESWEYQIYRHHKDLSMPEKEG
ncbi:hypothetical protein [Marinicella rhabdoformis]|uniref:hypothetical protein n=1 Tax=Marinicella rhabdoformis TaxID=2580566 RepID=UPI0012AEC72B|nr:hypothetical protein [Marinicella rhabdoformis]